jgi:uncharacterized protein
VTKRFLLGVLLFTVSPFALRDQNVFDFHVHIWNGDTSVREYFALLKRDQQEVAGVGAILIARKPGQLDETRRQNSELIALATRYPTLMPIASVHPYDGTAALDELKRVAAAGVKVIKLHPHTQEFAVTDPRVFELCQLAGKLGIFVLIDNANIITGDSQDLFNLAIKCSDTQFIFAHLGALDFRFWNILWAARTAKDFYKENIHFDISAIVTLLAGSPVEKEFIWTIRNVGIENVLLGSDYPQFSLKANVDALERLDLTAAEKAKIRFGNAQRFFFSDQQKKRSGARPPIMLLQGWPAPAYRGIRSGKSIE